MSGVLDLGVFDRARGLPDPAGFLAFLGEFDPGRMNFDVYLERHIEFLNGPVPGNSVEPSLEAAGAERKAPKPAASGQDAPGPNSVAPVAGLDDRPAAGSRFSLFPDDPDPLGTIAALARGVAPVGPGKVDGDVFRGVASWLTDYWRKNVADPGECLRNKLRGIDWVEDRYVPDVLLRLAATDRPRAEKLAREFLRDMELARLPLMGCGGLLPVAVPAPSLVLRMPGGPSARAVPTNSAAVLAPANAVTIPIPSGAAAISSQPTPSPAPGTSKQESKASEDSGNIRAGKETVKHGNKPEKAKVKLEHNPKHHPNSESPEPKNVLELFNKSVKANNGTRWVKDDNSVVHRFSEPSNGLTHWNGSTGGKNPIKFNDIPSEIKKLFGIKR